MKDIFSNIITMLSLCLIVLAGSALMSMNIQVANARNFHSNAIDRIQSSLYASSVVEDCKNEARALGYNLWIEDVTIYDERRDIKVTLEYTIPGWFLNEDQTGVLIGYAR